ncbi:MAG: ABC transporter ATP-binding protein [Chloroflexi bacterium]|nr:ABC transporter ATP-binding protein [Chloroflexota bacterium]
MSKNKISSILDVKNLKTYFYTEEGIVKAVDGVDFYVNPGEVLGLVGESGCGKSVTSFSVMGLVEKPGRVVDGEISFANQNLLALSESEMINLRGNQMSMIYQQPQICLNPIYKVGAQIAEVLMIHNKLPKAEAWAKTVDLLELVGIPDPHKKVHAYPHEMSGGQAQRVMIAMALALKPKLLIADEPTTALDVTIQAQILDLILDLREQFDTAVILITHDLGVIAEMADRVAVMYAGQIVEEAETSDLMKNPLHPYAQGLNASVPVLGKVKDRLTTIPGSVPNLINLPSGCRFSNRCQLQQMHKLDICTKIEPPLSPISETHRVRCWLYLEGENHTPPIQL